MSRLGIRNRLFLVVVAAVAVALAAMIVGFNLLLGDNLSSNADSVLRARASAELGSLAVHGGRLVVTEAPDDAAAQTDVWVFSRGRALEAPRAGARVTAAAERLAASAPGFIELTSPDARLYAVPVVRKGRRLGTLVAAVSLKPYEETRRTALLASLALGGGVLLLVALAVRWLLASSLRPVARMTRQAAAWSERDLDRRFGLGPAKDELTELAATLDGLLDRLATSLRREHHFSAELSHELRTPLSRIVAETELALKRPRTSDEYRGALELVHRNALQLGRTIDALVAAARHEAGGQRGTADAYEVARAAAAACAGPSSEGEVAVQIAQPARPIRLGLDADLAERILQPVVENACRYGLHEVRIAITRSDGTVSYSVDDDGPGVAEAERERIFEPGARGGASRGNGSAGAGLGLALARRLARSVSGEIEAGSGRGGHFVVRLPTA